MLREDRPQAGPYIIKGELYQSKGVGDNNVNGEAQKQQHTGDPM